MRLLLSKYRDREDGFTLVELLIVVLIIGVLAAIAIPVYLGIQGQAHKSAVKADVNQKVKSIQVALVEGSTVTSQYGTTVGSDKGSSVTIAASTTSGAGAKDFTVAGAESTTVANSSGDKGSVDYTYTYDSVTGQFTEGDGSVVLGGGGGGGGTTAPTFTTTSLPGGVVGTSYNQTIVATGTPTPVLSKTTGNLPTGVTFTAATGNLSGTPTTAGSYTFTIKAQNSAGAPTQSYTIVVTQAPSFTTTSLPNGTVGTSYNQTIVATGTPAPVYTLDSGTLPAGLILDQNSGALAGTPTTATTYNFVIKATNSAGNPTQAYTVTIAPSAAPTPAASFTVSTNGLTVTLDPSASTNANGSGPYYWDTGDGNSGRPSTTIYNYTYAAAGTYTITLTVRNGIGGPTATTTRTVTVYNFTPIVQYSENFEAGSGSNIAFWGYSATGYDPVNVALSTGGTPGCYNSSAYCALMNPTSFTNGQTVSVHAFSVITGATYKIEAWVRANAASTNVGTVSGWSPNATTVSSSTCNLATTGTTWCKITYIYTSTVTGTPRAGLLWTYPTTGSTTANTAVLMDDVTFTRLN